MNLYIVDYKPNGECVWIPLDELNNYIDRDNYPDKVSGKRGKMKRYWTESISSFEVRNTTIEPYEDIEVYKADEVDVEIERLKEMNKRAYDNGYLEACGRYRKALEEMKKYIIKITCIEGDHIVIGLKRKEVLFIYKLATEALKERED